MILILTGKTCKGKNRVREHGDKWSLISSQDIVAFNADPGPWHLICPVSEVGSKKFSSNARWIHGKDDDDFDVEYKQLDN